MPYKFIKLLKIYKIIKNLQNCHDQKSNCTVDGLLNGQSGSFYLSIKKKNSFKGSSTRSSIALSDFHVAVLKDGYVACVF